MHVRAVYSNEKENVFPIYSVSSCTEYSLTDLQTSSVLNSCLGFDTNAVLPIFQDSRTVRLQKPINTLWC